MGDESAYEPMPQSPSRFNGTPSTFEINDPTTENTLQNVLGLSRGGNYNLCPNPNPNYSEL